MLSLVHLQGVQCNWNDIEHICQWHEVGSTTKLTDCRVVFVMQPNLRNNIKGVEIDNKRVIHALTMNNIDK